MKAVWITFIVLAAILGLAGFGEYYAGAQSAPQQSAAALSTLTGVGILYFITRAVQEVMNCGKASAPSKPEASAKGPEEVDPDKLRQIVQQP